jgi:Fe-S-cluster containining protein
MEIYREMDTLSSRFQNATGLRCLPGCGTCCDTEEVEATVVEVIPLCWQILLSGEEERYLCSIEKSEKLGNQRCVIYDPARAREAGGCCSFYEFRPLVCRLFGFAARRDKKGGLEFAACKWLKDATPEVVIRAQIGVGSGLPVPIYQDAFMRVASVNPALGFRRLPINQAIKEALGYLFWKRPASESAVSASPTRPPENK